jgi:hypothetical protein
VLSEEIGCAEDLVVDGVNGATFMAGDIKGLSAVLRPLLVDPDYRQRVGRASLDRIACWSYRECAEGLRDAIKATNMQTDAKARPLARSLRTRRNADP